MVRPRRTSPDHRSSAPPRNAFTPQERKLIQKLRTPEQVQRYFNRLPYNTDARNGQDTLRSFREMVRHGKAHCMEAALSAAVILEQHGYPPLVMSLESADGLDHVIFVYRERGRFGSVARSRDPGLHGRKPRFRTLRALAMSYFDAYVDATGSLTGFGLFDLRKLRGTNWRFSRRNLLAVERALIRLKHTHIPRQPERVRRMRVRYLAYRAMHGGKKPLFYRGRENWTGFPKEFL